MEPSSKLTSYNPTNLLVQFQSVTDIFANSLIE